MNSWWETPVCSAFLNTVKEEIFGGKIVLVFLPNHAPPKFLPELKKVIEKKHEVQFRKFNLSDCNESEFKPVESLLYTDYELYTKNYIVQKRASEIISAIDFNTTEIIVFESLNSNLVSAFNEFLIDAGRYLSGIPKHERHKILAVIEPSELIHDDFKLEAGIQKLYFKGCYGKLDNLLGIKYLYGSDNELNEEFFESFIASLAQFDFRLIKLLIDSDDLLVDYINTLTQFALDCKWNDFKFKELPNLTEQEKWERWSAGIIDFIGGKVLYNSAYLAINNKKDKLEKRIWNSAIEVLLPMIEELRTRILNCNKLVFPFKFQNKRTGELIINKFDLEIGEICFGINNREIELRWFSRDEKSRLIDFVYLCKDIRNDLSHLKLPEVEDIKKFYLEYNYIDLMLDSIDITGR